MSIIIGTTPTESSNNALLRNNRETTINDLPIELLAKIFVDCLSSVPLPPNKKHAPLLLCNVTTHWRRIALSTPALWSQIKADVPELDWGQEWDKGKAWIATWLERSGNSPLTLILDVDGDTDSVQILLRLIAPHAYRWKFLSLKCNATAYSDECYPEWPRGGAPLLECVDISISRSYLDLWDWLCTVFDRSPRLHTITSSLVPFCFSWRQIRSITLSYRAHLHSLQCREILEDAPSLESANLFITEVVSSDAESDSDSPPNLLPLRHDNLCRLRLASYIPLAPLLDCLTLPALRELNIKHGEDPTVWQQHPYTPLSQHLHSLLTRSSCSISKLSLSITMMKEDELITCLSHPSVNNSLVELSIPCITFFPKDSFFDHLTVREGAPCILPKLETIRIINILCVTDGVVSQMATSRCVGQPGPTPPRNCQLRRLTIWFTTKPEKDRPKDFAQFNALAASESEFSVSFEPFLSAWNW